MSIITKLVKAGAWLTIASLVSKLASLITIPLLARFLLPEGLGIYNVVFSLAQSAQGFSSLGITIAMERNGAQYKTIGTEAVGRLFGVGLITICLVNLITGLGVWLFRQPLAVHWLAQPKVASLLGWAAILICLQPFGNVPLLFLASLQDFRAYAFRSSLGIIVSSIVTLVFAWYMGLTGAILGMIVAAIAQIFWSYLIVKPVLQTRGISLRWDQFYQELVSILSFGFPYYLGNTLLGSLVGLPLMGLVSHYGGLEQLGYLRVAQSMAAIIGFIPSAIAPAAVSYLSATSVDDKQSYHYLQSVHLRGVWILLLVPTGAFCLILPELIYWLFGKAYENTTLLSWLCLWISALAGVASILVQYLVVAGKTLRVTYASLIGVIGWVLSAVILVPNYSALGFLIAQAIGQLVGCLSVITPIFTDLKITDIFYLKKLAIITVFVFLYTLLIPWLNFNEFINYFVIIVTLLITCILIFDQVLYPAEKLKIKQLLEVIK